MNSKRLTRLSYLTLSAVLCWLMALPAYAASEAGRILFARGTVSIVDGNDAARGAGTGSIFYEGDRVVTGSKSVVQLRLSDGALTALRSNSDYQIQRQRFDEEEDVYEQAGRLLSGWMRSVTGAIGARHPGNVSQGTSVATIGIRGTTYQIIHVPEQGLAEFPNLQPGSYVYLEEGQVEVSNEAGSRVVSPGQVVRIAGRNVAPELTPDLVGLFQSPLLVGAPAGNDDFQIRNLLDDETDQIVDQGAGSNLPEFSGALSVLFRNCVACFPNPVVTEAPMTDVIVVAGEGNNKYLTELFLNNGDTQLKAIEGRSPSGSGSVGIYSGGELVSQAHWGHWLVDDHTEYGNTPSNPWHYIIADNVMLSPMDASGILQGKYRYNFTGGSELTQVAGSGLAPLTLQNSSNIVVDFSNAMALDVELNFRDSNANNIAMTCIGGCAIGEFYSGELQLDNSSQQSGNYFSGSMQGALLGAEAEGIMSLISITNNTDYIDYMGSAVFQREGSALLGPPLSIFGGVSAISAFNDGVLGTVASGNLVAEEVGTDWHPIQVVMNDGFGNYELDRTSTTPLSQDNYTMSATGSTVYWGIWDEISYSIGFAGDGVTPTGDWHYMITENILTAAEFDSLAGSLGLVGTQRYNYVGGTELEEVSSSGSPTSIASGFVDVNFADLGGLAAISASLDINSNSIVGSGSVAELYGVGIDLVGDLDPGVTGSITGAFAGTQVESLLGAVAYDDGLQSYVGTALFERVNP